MIKANKCSEYYNPVLWLFSFDIVPKKTEYNSHVQIDLV